MLFDDILACLLPGTVCAFALGECLGGHVQNRDGKGKQSDVVFYTLCM